MSRTSKLISTLALSLVAASSAANAQDHVYTLNNSLADQNGGPSLVGHGGTLSSSGYRFGFNTGLTLSNVFTTPSYTIMLHSEFDDLFAVTGWRKMIDMHNRFVSGPDYGLYSHDAKVNVYPYAQSVVPNYAAGQMATTVMTRDAATNVVSVYVNGTIAVSFVDAGGTTIFDQPNNIAWFFEDDFAGTSQEIWPGNVDYIATWDEALDARQVAGLSVNRNPGVAPEPASLVLLASGLLAIGGVAARRRR